MKRYCLLVALVLVSGCSTQSVREIGRAPAMSPIGSGLNYAQTPQLALYPKQPETVITGYSLWNDDRAALFKDARALNIGDILTVVIKIDDKASFDNQTDRSRTNASGMSGSVTATDATNDIAVNGKTVLGSNTATSGQGKIERSEKLELLVAAVVTGVLENQNLLISGSQEVRVNQEIRILNVGGIVRPQDVDAKNQVSYDKIAEARISYGGRGRLTEVQNAPIGQQFLDMFTPF